MCLHEHWPFLLGISLLRSRSWLPPACRCHAPCPSTTPSPPPLAQGWRFKKRRRCRPNKCLPRAATSPRQNELARNFSSVAASPRTPGAPIFFWLKAAAAPPTGDSPLSRALVTRVPLSLYLGPRLVNVVSLAYKILTANHVLIMQPKGRTTDECSIRVPQMSGRQF